MAYGRPVITEGQSEGGGAITENAVTYWDIDCADKRVRVIIDGVSGNKEFDGLEIPTTFVESHISRDGPAHRNMMTEVRFPAEWENTSVVEYIDAFDPETQSGYDRVLIRFQDVQSGGWTDHHYGFIRSVGGAEKTGVMKAWVADPSMLTTAIPFGAKFGDGGGTAIENTVQDIAATFVDETIFNDLAVVIDDAFGLDDDVTWAELEKRAIKGLQYHNNAEGGVNIEVHKTFKSNQHTIADALNWIGSVTDSEWWFDYQDGQLGLLFGNYDSTLYQSTEIDNLAGGERIDIIQNTALYDLSPVNAVTVVGRSSKTIFGQRIKELSNRHPVATAEYPPLVQRAGQQISGKAKMVDARTVRQAENAARQALKDEIMGVGNGSITAKGFPSVRVGDKVRAIPECDDQYVDYGRPFEWGVTEITHTKQATDEYQTEVKVGPYVDDTQIKITDSQMKSTTEN